MLRSLYSGISGLRAHQTMMDVVGNNIANVNSAGFKTSQTVFEDTLSQTIKNAGAPQGTAGGTNPAQIGLGVRLSTISTNFTQGAAQTTGKATDLEIQGDGFFVVHAGQESVYTRNGNFSFDSDGRLVTSNGNVVQGWTGNNGVIDTNASVGDIKLPTGTLRAPTATGKAELGGNLSAEAAAGQIITETIPMYDAQGTAHSAVYTLTKLAGTATTNSWSLGVKIDGTTAASAPATLDFSAVTGKLTGPAPVAPSTANVVNITAPWGAVALDVSATSQYGGASTVAALSQNGSTAGGLTALTISPNGTLVGVFSNGLKQPLAQLALANFNNPTGLEKIGGSIFRTSVNSGTAQLGQAGTGSLGTLANNTLEMSNVDLASEFTNLIVAQRGFQANSRVITTSDEILQELVNLKR